MNPKITITVDAKNKAIASFDGIASVGAKVDVEVRGLPSGIANFGSGDDWTGPSLRMRILDDDGNDIVRFPLEKKTSEKVIGGDQWTKTTVSGADTYANASGTVVDFDTEGLREQFNGEAYDSKKSFGIVLDSAVDKAEFAVGKIKIRQWLTASVDDPTVLPNWTEIQEKLNTVDAKVEKPAGSDTATITITNTSGVTTTATVKDGEDGESGVTDYDDLTNRPSIGGVTLTGNKTLAQIGAVAAEDGKGLSSNDYTTSEKTKLSGVAAGATAVGVSASGTATDTVGYITVNGVEKKLAGGSSITLDDTVTQSSANGVKSSGIWSWVKSLLPSWLTSSYAEPATVASVTAETSRATAAEATKLNSAGPRGDDSVAWGSNGGITFNMQSHSPFNINGSHVFADGIHVNGVGNYYIDNTSGTLVNYLSQNYASAASVASKVGSFSAVGGVTPTVSSGVADLSTLFTDENTSLMTTINGVVGTPNATLETALGTAAS